MRIFFTALTAAAMCSVAQAGLEVTALGKKYQPDQKRVPIKQVEANTGGSTSVRNVDRKHLEWKPAGYYQRNRDLGQVFTPQETFWLDSIVLRTGPSDAAVLPRTPGAPVFIQFFEVVGEPKVNDNGTPQGSKAKHGFSTNHRCDDFVDGVQYKSIAIVRGGVFPQVPPTRDAQERPIGNEGRMHYMRWDLTGDDQLKFESGRKYAFMIGLEEPAEGYGFTLANANAASVNAPARMEDSHDRYHGGWGLRREGDGTVPPTMIPADSPPEDPAKNDQLLSESLFATGADRFNLSPTCDGYPDVDTYRDLEFYLEVHRSAPSK